MLMRIVDKSWRRVEGGPSGRSNRWGLMQSSACEVSVGNICLSICYILLFTVCVAETW